MDNFNKNEKLSEVRKIEIDLLNKLLAVCEKYNLKVDWALLSTPALFLGMMI